MSSATSAQKRFLPIVIAAVVLVIAVTTWRIATPRRSSNSAAPQSTLRAPTFRLYDQDSELVGLEGFMHRHVIVVVFFDDEQSPDDDPILPQLAEFYPALKKEGIVAVGVSTRLPQQNRGDDVRVFPFPLLSETTPGNNGSAHRNWGTLRERGPQEFGTTPAVFVINRMGQVASENGLPKPVASTESLMEDLLSGRWQ